MSQRRVVVTGMSGVTAFGNDWTSVQEKLKACENAVKGTKIPEKQKPRAIAKKVKPAAGITVETISEGGASSVSNTKDSVSKKFQRWLNK